MAKYANNDFHPQKMYPILEGKAGLVTGAGSGIGRAGAIAFAASGAKVMICGRREEPLQETKKMIEDAGGVCEYVLCDISKEDQVEALVKATVDKFGKLDFAFNNTAMDQPFMPIWERDAETFQKVVDTNLIGTFYCIKHEALVMTKQGSGSIVCTSSGAGAWGCPGQEPYATSKAGISEMVLCTCMDLGKYGVRINAILPGLTMTPMPKVWMTKDPEKGKDMLRGIPIGRAGEPEEQAYAALFLISDYASNINGALLRVDGGYTAGIYNDPDYEIPDAYTFMKPKK